jgi:hypothetical protein
MHYFSIVSSHDEVVDWVVKAPYVTNKQHFYGYGDTTEKVMARVKTYTTQMYQKTVNCYIVPYLLLQERVSKNKEVKVVFLRGQYSHIASIGQSTKQSHDPFTSDDVVAFAATALDVLKTNLQCSIVDGLVRVDVFKSNRGQLVVNEFESLDADFCCKAKGKAEEAIVFLAKYWEFKVYDAVTELCSR